MQHARGDIVHARSWCDKLQKMKYITYDILSHLTYHHTHHNHYIAADCLNNAHYGSEIHPGDILLELNVVTNESGERKSKSESWYSMKLKDNSMMNIYYEDRTWVRRSHCSRRASPWNMKLCFFIVSRLPKLPSQCYQMGWATWAMRSAWIQPQRNRAYGRYLVQDHSRQVL